MKSLSAWICSVLLPALFKPWKTLRMNRLLHAGLSATLLVTACTFTGLQSASTDYGTFGNGVYSNATAGISFTVPQGWHRLRPGQIQKVTQQSGNNKCLVLFVNHRRKPSASFSVITEKLDEAELEIVKTGADYSLYSAGKIKAASPAVQISKGPQIALGGTVFDTLLLTLPNGNTQRHYAAIRKETALVLCATHRDEDDKQVLTGILNSLSFPE